jgi:hypothetical protein
MSDRALTVQIKFFARKAVIRLPENPAERWRCVLSAKQTIKQVCLPRAMNKALVSGISLLCPLLVIIVI